MNVTLRIESYYVRKFDDDDNRDESYFHNFKRREKVVI